MRAFAYMILAANIVALALYVAAYVAAERPRVRLGIETGACASKSSMNPLHNRPPWRDAPQNSTKGGEMKIWGIRIGALLLAFFLGVGAGASGTEEAVGDTGPTGEAVEAELEATLKEKSAEYAKDVNEAEFRAARAEQELEEAQDEIAALQKKLESRERALAKRVKAEKEAEEKSAPAGGGKSFSGNGSKTLTFTSSGGNLKWTNDGDLFQIWEDGLGMDVFVNSQGNSGTTEIPAGKYTITVNAIGNWTIQVP